MTATGSAATLPALVSLERVMTDLDLDAAELDMVVAGARLKVIELAAGVRRLRRADVLQLLADAS